MTSVLPSHVALLTQLLDRRQEIVDRIERTLLNVRGKDTARSRDRRLFDQLLNACFFGLPGLPRELCQLKGQLAASHLADGFVPVPLDNYVHELDPLEFIPRAYLEWERRRWPGKSGRLTYAETIFTVCLLRQLEYLSLRIWDEGDTRAEAHLDDVQALLDRLNASPTPTAFVRDARWLIQTAQGPLTGRLSPYFVIADHIAASCSEQTRLGIHAAGAKLAGGHLRSQLRYRMAQTERPVDDPENLAITRNSNSMDSALLLRDLVPLLRAYGTASSRPDDEARAALADAILQGLSADPELLLVRLDLLTPCTMIEDLFITRGDDGQPRYSAMGEAYLRVVEEYGQLIGRLAPQLMEDARAYDPLQQVYSPYGITYGFCSDLLSNMATDTLMAYPTRDLSLEDVFVSHGRLEDKLARARGWEALPTRDGEQKHFDHSVEWAGQMFVRLTRALDARSRAGSTPNASGLPESRLFVVPESHARGALPDDFLPADIVRAEAHCMTSDVKRALSLGATVCSQVQFLRDRNEARFLASLEVDGQWFGVSKVLLTLVISHGTHALLTDVPMPVADLLRLTCPGLIALP